MKLIILDRDGVINQDSDDYIKSPEEWVPIPGSLQAIADLNQSGYRVVIASNQSGLARGLFDIDALNAIHRKMQHELGRIGGHIDGIFFCPHGPKAHCNCRKPKPVCCSRQVSAFSAIPALSSPSATVYGICRQPRVLESNIFWY